MIVRLMPRFEQRLEEIATFLKERYGDVVARRTFNEILAAARSLEQFARKGRMVPEIGADEIRELIVLKRYRVIYRVHDEEDAVDVVTVHHGKLPVDLDEILDD